MKGEENWFRRLGRELDDGHSPLKPQPLIEILGRKQVLLENHGGVCGYSPECVCVRVSYGQIHISGSDLQIVRMTRDQLVVWGKISEVKLCGRDSG